MIINIEQFAKNMGLPPKDLKNLYTTFLDEMEESILLLNKAVAEEKTDDIKDLLHNIKGVCLNMELTDVGIYAKEQYDKAKLDDFSGLDEFSVKFHNDIKTIYEIVKNYYNEP